MIEQIVTTIKSITFTDILTFLLALDTLRAVIAFLGWINPRSKFGRIIYGKQDVHIISAALQELGYSSDSSDAIAQKMEETARSFSGNASITEENAAEHLVALLANYTVKFDRAIQYGGRSISHSCFYIDTMEIPHNEADMQEMASLMCQLINSKRANKSEEKPNVIATPKGGNPFLAKEVARVMSSDLMISKSSTDKSRVSGLGEHTINEFKINYEGSWTVFDSQLEQSCIVVDCNTSGGSQLLDIVQSIRNLITKEGTSAKLQEPDEAYVLFRADLDGENIDQKFSDVNCSLFRYFDLDEDTKEDLYKLKQACQERGRSVSVYYPEDKADIQRIIESLKRNKKFYYN